MSAVDRLNKVRAAIASAAEGSGRTADDITLVAVSKTFPADAIRPVIEAGQRVFGENRVQEAEGKWPGLKAETPGIDLHLIGPLQSNKAANAVALFDVIETVDRDKIARALAAEMEKQGKAPRLYVQVNTGGEAQKAGIAPEAAAAFVGRCRAEHGLTISGLMCIPPVDEDPVPHFSRLRSLAAECGVPDVSMGMSADYETAIEQGATHVRVGSAIFGARDYPKG
jgi:hypothetical protein